MSIIDNKALNTVFDLSKDKIHTIYQIKPYFREYL
jgi:hypothetical protein